MMLARQLAVRLLQLLLRGGLGHAERGVVVLEIHRSEPQQAAERIQLANQTLPGVGARVQLVVEERPHPLDGLGHFQQPLHAGQVDAAFVH